MSTAGFTDATARRVEGAADPGSRPLPSIVLSFQTVYRQYFDFVWSAARRFGVAPDAMDDVVQEVFIVIHAKLDSLERPEALRNWIYGVVRRVASNHRRALRTQTAAGIVIGSYGETAESREPTPFEHLKTNADLVLLASLLNELDEPKREVFALVEIDELTVPEVADILEIPLNTAYSRLRAARQTFEAAVARRREQNKGT
ncbi:MAG TPA: sigma-70 family RNA polymerase sigma factor [Polyangiaceae bacterium]|jgi:RNA polymerase sigma-70 factor (ECF subfamily)|nr:sigma-70 family RNA polymerase sigma factor [Polyangiaceae bacterium]